MAQAPMAQADPDPMAQVPVVGQVHVVGQVDLDLMAQATVVPAPAVAQVPVVAVQVLDQGLVEAQPLLLQQLSPAALVGLAAALPTPLPLPVLRAGVAS